MKKLFFAFTFYLFAVSSIQAQEDDLLKSLENDQPKETMYTTATFKGTRLINGHTVECLGKKALEMRIGHRFGAWNSGEKEFWGLDQANMNITFDYGITDNLMIGIGRNSADRLYEGTIKYKLMHQAEDNSDPFTITLLEKANLLSNTAGSQYDDPVNQWSYITEVLLARKFNSKLSLQLTPTFIHINLAPATLSTNNITALTASGRYKFTRSLALTSEYTQTLNNYFYSDQATYIPVFSVGMDIETGGHVFQLFFSNANTLNEVQYIPFTTADWGRREFRFGFNISRVFGLGKKTTRSSY
jgi:hypothetical protein